jgi:tetratricopeptide (TPR) repeat protein
LRFLTLVVIGVGLLAHSAAGQPTHDARVPIQARALEEARDFSGAVRLLAPHVREHPEDARAWQALAQNLYWAGNVAAARAEFDLATARHPHDTHLRVAYGRMLVDLNEGPAATEVLVPVRAGGDSSAVGEAERLLGTLAYWRGDVSAAERQFRRSLELDSGDRDALRRLDEIRDQRRPWLKVAGGLQSDSQGIEGRGLSAEFGLSLTPQQSAGVRVSSRRFELEDVGGGTSAHEAAISHRAYWPALRLETDLAAGLLSRAPLGRADWTGRAGLGVRLGRGFTLTAAAQRAAYFYTEASLYEPVTTSTASLGLAWADRSGWSAHAGAYRTAFPDDNAQQRVSLRVLAPVASGAWGGVRAGYVFDYQHAEDSRYTLALGGPSRPRSSPPAEGHYAPYYTPNRLHAHSASWALELRPHRRVSVHGGGSYGFFAVEQAPYVYLSGPGGAYVRDFYENRFTPWEAQGSVQLHVGPSATIGLEVGHMRLAYYDATHAGLTLRYRFP